MNGRVFVDTNVLIYAHDVDAGEKHTRAVAVVRDLWEERNAALSTQVLQEFYVNVTRKIPVPLARGVARDIVAAYGTWHLHAVELSDVLRASEIEEGHQLSFWDALIVAAACRADAFKILSEDLNPGQRIAGILIENPLAGHRTP